MNKLFCDLASLQYALEMREKYTLRRKLFLVSVMSILILVVYSLLGFNNLCNPAELPDKNDHTSSDNINQTCIKEYNKLFESLQKQEQILNEKNIALQQKESALRKLESELEQQRNKLMTITDKLNSFLQKRKNKSSAYQQLVKVYESMSPENAATTLIELYQMDPVSTLEILARLQIRRSGEIFNYIGENDPKFAAELTTKLTTVVNAGNEELIK